MLGITIEDMHVFVEDISITIVGIEQNSLINGPTNRSSLTACLHEGGGGGGGGGVGGRKYSNILSLYVR